MSALSSTKFEYNTFTKKCEEFLIVLHELLLTHQDRLFVRYVGGQAMPFIWIPCEEFITHLSFKRNSFFSVIKFLSDNGLIVIQKPDFVAMSKTNCYAINYAVLKECLTHWDYYIREPFKKIIEFDPIHHIRKVPAFKQKEGRHKNRKGILNWKNGDGNNRPKALLKTGDNGLKRIFQTTVNPLRGYLNHNACEPNSEPHRSQRLSYGASRYASLTYQENCGSLGELIYHSAILLEKAVKGLLHPQYHSHRRRKPFVDLQRPQNFFAMVGAIFKRELFYPSRQNILKFAAWVKKQWDGDLTQALKFKNIIQYIQLNRKQRKTNVLSTSQAEIIPQETMTTEEKMELIQYEIAEHPTESVVQKETRLYILSKIGPYEYVSWFKDLPFEGESDYWFRPDSKFKEDYLTNRYSLGRFKFQAGKEKGYDPLASYYN